MNREGETLDTHLDERAEPRRTQPDTVHGLVRRHALATPGATALVHGERRVSYQELDRLSDLYALRLAARGVGPGTPLPVLLPRSVPLVVAMLAALKLGAGYALLDSAWPVDRLRGLVGQLGSELLVTDAPSPVPGVAAWSPAADGGERATAAEQRLLDSPGGGPLDVEVGPGDVCCVFFTSGTTGRPKGVVSPHVGTVRAADPDTFAPFGPDTVMTLATSQPWDAFSVELWGPLLSGGTVVVVDEPYLSGALLRDLTAREGVNMAWLPGSLFNMLVDEELDCFRDMVCVILGGERLSAPHVRTFLDAHPDITAIDAYGPVETTMFCTSRVIQPSDCEVEGGIPVGVPLPRTRVYVLDGERQCQAGELGEICVAGTGLALGYLGDPELTRRRFPTLRVGDRTERVYRTGDLGFHDADGVLHYRGRADRQLKVRGYRVEPADIEAVACRLPGVAGCAVVPRLAADGSCVGLFAFVTARAGSGARADGGGAGTGGLDTGALLARLSELLPGYQLPDGIAEIAEIPRTRNSKVDSAALTALAANATVGPAPAAGPAAALPAPESPLAELVAGVFASVVGRPAARIPAGATLTELGATSIDAGRVAARLGEALGRPVPVSQVFRTPTAAALAQWIEETGGRAAPEPDSEPGAGSAAGTAAGTRPEPPDEGRAVLAPLQAGMLMEHLLGEEGLSMHCLLAWRIDGEPDRSALRKALGYVHRRHRILSSVFRLDDVPVAEYSPAPFTRIRELLVDTESQARALLARELCRPFKLDEGAAWHAALVTVRGSALTLFGVAFHHIAFDGASGAWVAGDLSRAYNAFLAGTFPDLPPAPTPAQVVAARARQLRYVDLDAQRDYWRGQVADVPVLHYPGGSDREAARPSELIEIRLPDATVRGVGRIAAEHGVSPFVVYLSAYGQALAELVGQSDFGVGTPLLRRGDSTLDRAVNCLTDVLCLRLRNQPGLPAAQAIAATAEVVAGAFAAQDLPVQEVIPLLEHPAPGERNQLVQNMFALQNTVPAVLDLDGLRTDLFRPRYPGAPNEVFTEIWPTADGGAELVVSHQPHRVSSQFCRELAARYLARLEAYLD